jgi:hypothetical protein
MEAQPKPQIEFRSLLHPLLQMLPPHLKDPQNYEKIQKEIMASFVSNCGHNEMMEWANCKKCTKKMLQRRILLKRLGFKNAIQYMLWQRLHTEIKKRISLAKYNKAGLMHL